jgi:hypothetical protein
MRSLFLLVVFLAAVPAQCGPSPTAEPVLVDLGETLVGDMIFHGPSQQLVVASDDELLLFDRAGNPTGTVGNIPDPIDPEAAGQYVVVASPPVGELVVVDPAAGTIVKRIVTGTQRISSISVQDDTVYFAHGPDQWDAGIGKASISAGTATASFMTSSDVYAGALIDTSPAIPGRVYFGNNEVFPSSLDWVDENGNQGREPYHDTYLPFAVSEAGDVVWAYNDGNVVSYDADTLNRAGFFFETPPAGSYGRSLGGLYQHGSRLALAGDTIVTQYLTSSNRVHTAIQWPVDDGRTRIVGFAMDDTTQFVAVSDFDRWSSAAFSSAIYIAGVDFEGFDPAQQAAFHGGSAALVETDE